MRFTDVLQIFDARRTVIACLVFCVCGVSIQAAPPNGEHFYAQGIAAEKQGDLAGAVFYYSECQELARKQKLPKLEASALHRQAVIKAQSKKFTESAELFRKAIALDSANTSILCDFAQLYTDRRMYDDAETILKNAFLAEPNNKKVLYNLGTTICQQRNRQTEGFRYLKLALGEAEGYRELAKMYRSKGDVGQADFAEQKAKLAETAADTPSTAEVDAVSHAAAIPVPMLTPPAVVQQAKEDLLRLETKEAAENKTVNERNSQIADVLQTSPLPAMSRYYVKPNEPVDSIPAPVAQQNNNTASERAAIPAVSLNTPQTPAQTDTLKPLIFVAPKPKDTSETRVAFIRPANTENKPSTDIRKVTPATTVKNTTTQEDKPPAAAPLVRFLPSSVGKIQNEIDKDNCVQPSTSQSAAIKRTPSVVNVPAVANNAPLPDYKPIPIDNTNQEKRLRNNSERGTADRTLESKPKTEFAVKTPEQKQTIQLFQPVHLIANERVSPQEKFASQTKPPPDNPVQILSEAEHKPAVHRNNTNEQQDRPRNATVQQFRPAAAPNVLAFGIADSIKKPTLVKNDYGIQNVPDNNTALAHTQVMPPRILDFAVKETRKELSVEQPSAPINIIAKVVPLPVTEFKEELAVKPQPAAPINIVAEVVPLPVTEFKEELAVNQEPPQFVVPKTIIAEVVPPPVTEFKEELAVNQEPPQFVVPKTIIAEAVPLPVTEELAVKPQPAKTIIAEVVPPPVKEELAVKPQPAAPINIIAEAVPLPVTEFKEELAVNQEPPQFVVPKTIIAEVVPLPVKEELAVKPHAPKTIIAEVVPLPVTEELAVKPQFAVPKTIVAEIPKIAPPPVKEELAVKPHAPKTIIAEVVPLPVKEELAVKPQPAAPINIIAEVVPLPVKEELAVKPQPAAPINIIAEVPKIVPPPVKEELAAKPQPVQWDNIIANIPRIVPPPQSLDVAVREQLAANNADETLHDPRITADTAQPPYIPVVERPNAAFPLKKSIADAPAVHRLPENESQSPGFASTRKKSGVGDHLTDGIAEAPAGFARSRR